MITLLREPTRPHEDRMRTKEENYYWKNKVTTHVKIHNREFMLLPAKLKGL